MKYIIQKERETIFALYLVPKATHTHKKKFLLMLFFFLCYFHHLIKVKKFIVSTLIHQQKDY
jgi:hypothetical protein